MYIDKETLEALAELNEVLPRLTGAEIVSGGVELHRCYFCNMFSIREYSFEHASGCLGIRLQKILDK